MYRVLSPIKLCVCMYVCMYVIDQSGAKMIATWLPRFFPAHAPVTSCCFELSSIHGVVNEKLVQFVNVITFILVF